MPFHLVGIMGAVDIQASQEMLYDFFLHSVQRDPSDEVLTTFRRLFVEHTQATESSLPVALYTIVIANNSQEFKYTLKRVCYILINNWGIQRNSDAIKALIKMFEDRSILRAGISVMMKRLREWLQDFISSEDFKDLQLFAARYDEEEKHWSERYTSYLLVPQYLDLTNPLEQREAARTLSFQLKEEFRFDLAMYTAKSQFTTTQITLPNPTYLGDSVLKLMKVLLIRPGSYSYESLANLFRQQSKGLSYWNFKQALLHYLWFALPRSGMTHAIQSQLPERILALYSRHNHLMVDDALALRTCNRVVDILTTEDRQRPSVLFSMILSQGNPLIPVLLLLKLTLYCRNVQAHLESCVANLIRYYETFSEDDCRWVITFFEVFRIAFSIYGENTDYNLIRLNTNGSSANPVNLEAYRVFSQLRRNAFDMHSVERGLLEYGADYHSRYAVDEPEELPMSIIAVS
jgi:hypothetical protein